MNRKRFITVVASLSVFCMSMTGMNAGKVREMVESISYPGNPALDTQEGFDNSGSDQDDKQNEDQNSEAGETETSNEVNVDTDEDSGNNIYLETLTLVREDGSTFTITQQTNGDYCYRDDDGVGYTDNGDESYTDEYGNTYRALNDATHYLGITLEQHTLESSDGNTVTVTQTTNGDYYYRDDNGTGFTDNGDGTWTDENGNDYIEIN